MNRAPRRGSRPLPENLRSDLHALVRQRGERAAADAIGFSRYTLARCLSGLGVYPGTVELVQRGLVTSTGPQ